MRDKTLNVFLMLIFGTGGITILVLASTHEGPLAEKVITVLVGSFGLLWVLALVLKLILVQTKSNTKKHLTDVEAERSLR